MRAQRPLSFTQWDYTPSYQPTFRGEQVLFFYGGSFGRQTPYPIVLYWVQVMVNGQPVAQIYPDPYGVDP